METFGNQLSDETFNQAVTSLEEIDTLVGTISESFTPYAGNDADLIKNSDALQDTLDSIAELSDAIRPFLEKTAENIDYVASSEDLVQLKTVESLLASIDASITDVESSMNAYDQKQSK
jgi:ABC-type transporter Mla subunit MlaD